MTAAINPGAAETPNSPPARGIRALLAPPGTSETGQKPRLGDKLVVGPDGRVIRVPRERKQREKGGTGKQPRVGLKPNDFSIFKKQDGTPYTNGEWDAHVAQKREVDRLERQKAREQRQRERGGDLDNPNSTGLLGFTPKRESPPSPGRGPHNGSSGEDNRSHGSGDRPDRASGRPGPDPERSGLVGTEHMGRAEVVKGYIAHTREVQRLRQQERSFLGKMWHGFADRLTVYYGAQKLKNFVDAYRNNPANEGREPIFTDALVKGILDSRGFFRVREFDNLSARAQVTGRGHEAMLRLANKPVSQIAENDESRNRARNLVGEILKKPIGINLTDEEIAKLNMQYSELTPDDIKAIEASVRGVYALGKEKGIVFVNADSFKNSVTDQLLYAGLSPDQQDQARKIAVRTAMGAAATVASMFSAPFVGLAPNLLVSMGAQAAVSAAARFPTLLGQGASFEFNRMRMGDGLGVMSAAPRPGGRLELALSRTALFRWMAVDWKQGKGSYPWQIIRSLALGSAVGAIFHGAEHFGSVVQGVDGFAGTIGHDIQHGLGLDGAHHAAQTVDVSHNPTIPVNEQLTHYSHEAQTHFLPDTAHHDWQQLHSFGQKDVQGNYSVRLDYRGIDDGIPQGQHYIDLMMDGGNGGAGLHHVFIQNDVTLAVSGPHANDLINVYDAPGHVIGQMHSENLAHELGLTNDTMKDFYDLSHHANQGGEWHGTQDASDLQNIMYHRGILDDGAHGEALYGVRIGGGYFDKNGTFQIGASNHYYDHALLHNDILKTYSTGKGPDMDVPAFQTAVGQHVDTVTDNIPMLGSEPIDPIVDYAIHSIENAAIFVHDYPGQAAAMAILMGVIPGAILGSKRMDKTGVIGGVGVAIVNPFAGLGWAAGYAAMRLGKKKKTAKASDATQATTATDNKKKGSPKGSGDETEILPKDAWTWEEGAAATGEGPGGGGNQGATGDNTNATATAASRTGGVMAPTAPATASTVDPVTPPAAPGDLVAATLATGQDGLSAPTAPAAEEEVPADNEQAISPDDELENRLSLPGHPARASLTAEQAEKSKEIVDNFIERVRLGNNATAKAAWHTIDQDTGRKAVEDQLDILLRDPQLTPLHAKLQVAKEAISGNIGDITHSERVQLWDAMPLMSPIATALDLNAVLDNKLISSEDLNELQAQMEDNPVIQAGFAARGSRGDIPDDEIGSSNFAITDVVQAALKANGGRSLSDEEVFAIAHGFGGFGVLRRDERDEMERQLREARNVASSEAKPPSAEEVPSSGPTLSHQVGDGASDEEVESSAAPLLDTQTVVTVAPTAPANQAAHQPSSVLPLPAAPSISVNPADTGEAIVPPVPPPAELPEGAELGEEVESEVPMHPEVKAILRDISAIQHRDQIDKLCTLLEDSKRNDPGLVKSQLDNLLHENGVAQDPFLSTEQVEELKRIIQDQLDPHMDREFPANNRPLSDHIVESIKSSLQPTIDSASSVNLINAIISTSIEEENPNERGNIRNAFSFIAIGRVLNYIDENNLFALEDREPKMREIVAAAKTAPFMSETTMIPLTDDDARAIALIYRDKGDTSYDSYVAKIKAISDELDRKDESPSRSEGDSLPAAA